MPNIPVIPVDKNILQATNNLAESMSDEINLIHVNPPAQSDGMDAASEFLESVHFLELKKRFLRSTKNVSPTCGMEIWYEDNTVKFMFYTPSKEIEQEYRQQLTGYYPECEIAQQTSNEGMFIRAEEEKEEAMAVMNFQLAEHHFMPLASPVSEDSELETDPLKRIINEIDTKDDTRLMLQYLYKPAPYSWTEGQQSNLETKAKAIQNKGGFKTRYWGFKIDEVDDPGIYETAASEMRARLNKSAYFLNIRLAIICSGENQEMAKKKSQTRAKAVVNTLEHLYATRAGQKLVPKSYTINKERSARELIVNMIERNAENMYQPKRFSQWLWHKLTPNNDIIVLTAGELAGHVHLPSEDDVSTGAIGFRSEMVSGEVPPDVEDFEPVPKEERTGYEDDEIPDLTSKDELEGDSSSSEDKDTPSTLFDEGGD
jgi:hypothetical protein